MLVYGQVGEEGGNLSAAQFTGMAVGVVADEATDPVYIGLFGADGVVSDAERLAYLVEQGGEVRGNGWERGNGWGRGVGGQIEGMVEDVAIEEEDGEAGLAALGGVGEGGEKRHDVGCGQRVGVMLGVEEDEACHPGDVGFFGGGRIVACAQGGAHLIEQFRGLRWHRWRLRAFWSCTVFGGKCVWHLHREAARR